MTRLLRWIMLVAAGANIIMLSVNSVAIQKNWNTLAQLEEAEKQVKQTKMIWQYLQEQRPAKCVSWP